MAYNATQQEDELLYNSAELYLSVIGYYKDRCTPAEIESCLLDFPNLLRKDADGKGIAYKDDCVDFLVKSTGLSELLCNEYLAVRGIQFVPPNNPESLKRSPVENVAERIKNITNLELDEFSYKLFKQGDVQPLHAVLDNLAIAGNRLNKLGKLISDVRYYSRLNFKGLVSEDELVAKPSLDYVMDWMSERLYSPASTDEMMKYVIKNASSGDHLVRLTSQYRTDPGEVQGPVVNLCRDQDGTLRSKDYFKGCLDHFMPVLIQSAFHFDDLEAFKQLQSFPGIAKSGGDGAVQRIANKVVGYYKAYAKDNHQFDMKSRWLFKEYGNPILQYWNEISKCKAMESVVSDIKNDHKWSDVFVPEYLKLAPADFIDQLLTATKVSALNANRFIFEMHQAGIDCNQGFVLTTVGRFQYEVQKHEPVDHAFMIRMCLADIKKPGRIGFLATVPLELIIGHPSRDEMLKPLYELTGEPRLLKAMNLQMLGKVFGQDMGI
jgi:hypothetical protein